MTKNAHFCNNYKYIKLCKSVIRHITFHTVNQRVLGSSPREGATKEKTSQRCEVFFVLVGRIRVEFYTFAT